MSHIEPQARRCKAPAGDIVIRTARPGDAGALLELARQVMSEREVTLTEWDETDRSVAGEERWIQQAADRPSDLVLVAEAEGEVVGILDFATRRKRKLAHTGEFGMSVDRRCRDRGIGRAMLGVLIDWAAAQPEVEKVDLRVFATNRRAIHLYESLGFREEGRQAKAVKLAGDWYDDLVLMGRFVGGGSSAPVT